MEGLDSLPQKNLTMAREIFCFARDGAVWLIACLVRSALGALKRDPAYNKTKLFLSFNLSELFPTNMVNSPGSAVHRLFFSS